jgi:peptide/nickel transport system substrate-binding protein/oligopeptide transport system substrate-binding protein
VVKGAPASRPPTTEPEPGLLRVAVGPIDTLDPMRAADPSAILVVRQLFEGLTRWDPARGTVEPAAARDWEVERGGRRFVFHLRPGMTFHDGTPLTASSFRAAFDRIARRRNASDVAYTLERVRGFDRVNRLGTAVHLRGVQVRDELTLVITLDRPYQDFPTVLTHPALVPLPPWAQQEPGRFALRPVGNGPYRLTTDVVPGEPLRLTARGAPAGAPRALEFVPFEGPGEALLALIDGGVDIAEVPPSEAEAAARVFGERGYRPLLAGYYLGVNVRAGELRRFALRKAISLAIDREAIAQQAFQGALVPARGIVPPGLPGFDADLCAELCRADPAEARRLVASLPARARRVTLQYAGGALHERVARLARTDLEAVGLQVRLSALPFERYIARLARGGGRVFRLGWIAEYPTADVFLSALFASGSPDNHSGFSNRRVDRLLARAHQEPSPGVRTVLYRRAEALVLQHLAVIPIGSFRSLWAAGPRVGAIAFDVLGGFDAASVTLTRP